MSDKTVTVVVEKSYPIASIACLLSVLLIIAKLSGFLNIGWIWTIAPIWFPPVFAVSVVLAVILFCFAIGMFAFACFWLYEKLGGRV